MKREVEAAPLRPRLDGWPKQGLHAAWIGHSTVVISIDGFIVVTDPVFSNRIGIGLGPVTLGLKRLVEPALTLANIPRPDLILLSHAHMDHFDLPSLRKLEGRATTVITAVNTSDLLRVKRYGAVHELGWGQSMRVGPATVRAFEVNHWGARMRNDTQRSYNGYVIRRAAIAWSSAGTRRIRICSKKYGLQKRWISRSCRLGLTIRGFGCIALRSRRCGWQTISARISFYRFITGRSR